jgi:hypothetical protein
MHTINSKYWPTRLRMLLGLVMLWQINAETSSATDYFVRLSGSDKADGRSAKSAFKTLDYAISKCSGKDRIYVGAGTHNVVVSRSLPSSTQLDIIGDTSGKQTGDKGTVTLACPSSNWGLNLRGGKSLSLLSLEFSGLTPDSSSGLTTSGTGSVSVVACAFRNLYDAALCDGTQVQIEDSHIVNIKRYGLRLVGGSGEVKSTAFSNCQYAMHASALRSLSIGDCQFQSSLSGVTTYGIFADSSGIEIQKSLFSGFSTGLQATNSSQLSLDKCTIEQFTAWGVNGSGGKCDLTDCLFVGKDKTSGTGFFYNTTGGSTPRLTSCNFNQMYCGLRTDGADYKFKDVQARGNQIGYLANQTSGMSINLSTKELVLEDNYIGLYVSNSPTKLGSMRISGIQLSNNDYGLYSNYSSIVADRCSFSKNSRGAWVINAADAHFTQCDFQDNNTRNTWSHVGARLDAKRATVSRCSFKNNDSGLQITNLDSIQPTLDSLTFLSNKSYGLMVYNGQFQLSGRQNIDISGSQVAVYTSNADTQVDSWTGPKSCNYALYCNGGQLQFSDSRLTGGTVGVYANRNTAVELARSSFTGQTSYGLLANLPSKIQMTDCSFDKCKSVAAYCN